MTEFFRKRLCDPRWWRSQAVTLVLIVVVVSVISVYQQRNMVSGIAPALHGQTLSGEQAEPSSTGATLVYFWGSWCGICSFTSPAVSAIAEDVAGTNQTVLTVALASGDDATLHRYLQEHGYQFPTLNDDNGVISREWGVGVTPSLFYLNPEGEIVWVSSGLSSEWGMRAKLWLARYL